MMNLLGKRFALSLYCLALLCVALLGFALLCTALLGFALLCVALPLYCFALLCLALLCVALPCFALYCFALHGPALLCIPSLNHTIIWDRSGKGLRIPAWPQLNRTRLSSTGNTISVSSQRVLEGRAERKI